MLATRYRLALLAELAILASIAAAFVLSGRWSAMGGWLFVPVAMLSLRLALCAFQFVLAWRWRTPRAPLGFSQGAALFAMEYVALLRFGLLDVPFDNLRLRPDAAARPSAGMPIVLIHGYYANRGCFRRLVRALEADGHGPIFTPNLRSFDAGIEDYEAGLHAAMERIGTGTGRKALLLAHSMGGLGARAYLARRGEARVAALVTIASPHHGSALAAFASGGNAKQMQVGSEFLRDLAAEEARTPRAIPTTCLYAPYDNMVMPQDTARLDWARNIAVPGVAHLSILECEALRSVVREAVS